MTFHDDRNTLLCYSVIFTLFIGIGVLFGVLTGIYIICCDDVHLIPWYLSLTNLCWHILQFVDDIYWYLQYLLPHITLLHLHIVIVIQGERMEGEMEIWRNTWHWWLTHICLVVDLSVSGITLFFPTDPVVVMTFDLFIVNLLLTFAFYTLIYSHLRYTLLRVVHCSHSVIAHDYIVDHICWWCWYTICHNFDLFTRCEHPHCCWPFVICVVGVIVLVTFVICCCLTTFVPTFTLFVYLHCYSHIYCCCWWSIWSICYIYIGPHLHLLTLLCHDDDLLLLLHLLHLMLFDLFIHLTFPLSPNTYIICYIVPFVVPFVIFVVDLVLVLISHLLLLFTWAVHFSFDIYYLVDWWRYSGVTLGLWSDDYWLFDWYDGIDDRFGILWLTDWVLVVIPMITSRFCWYYCCYSIRLMKWRYGNLLLLMTPWRLIRCSSVMVFHWPVIFPLLTPFTACIPDYSQHWYSWRYWWPLFIWPYLGIYCCCYGDDWPVALPVIVPVFLFFGWFWLGFWDFFLLYFFGVVKFILIF